MKKQNRKSIGVRLAVLLLMVFAGAERVAQANLGNNLVQDTAVLAKLGEVSSNVSNTSNMIGRVSPDSPLTKYSSSIASMLDNSLSLSGDSVWSMQNVAANPTEIDNWRNLSWSVDEVGKKLYPKRNAKNGISYEEHDRAQANRYAFFEESAKTGVALAETKQATVRESQQAVASISKNATRAANLHEDLEVNNQAQVVMANELVQIRQLLAKQLELMSALHLKVYSDYTAPMKLAVDPKEEERKERERVQRQKQFDRELSQRIARIRAGKSR